jgi:hypothetical protein
MNKMTGLKWNIAPELLELAKENPTLPIFAEVYYEVVALDVGYMDWIGEITNARVDSIWNGARRCSTLSEVEDDSESFVRDEAPEELLEKWEDMDNADYDKAVDEWIKSLPWMKCIIVYVDLPDDLPDAAGQADD